MSDKPSPRRLGEEIERLISEFGGPTEPGYVHQLIKSALDISKTDVSTLDAKIAASALREMQQAFKMMAPFRDRKKVTIFGSARTSKG
ncbi:MAG: Rossman fold protein, TIGR00730 family, partial [Actinomycetota bacterium]